MNTMRILHGMLIATAVSSMAFTNLAMAVDLTPANGLWIIDEENNGEPGRGFQLDTQNETLSLTFYGYDDSGLSTWWLAAGVFESGSNELTMDLETYSGGMAFGDPLKDATYLGSDGTVTVRFDSITSGEICLPKETCKSISTINFGWFNSASELLGTWKISGTYPNGLPFGIEGVFTAVLPPLGPAVVDRVQGTGTLDYEGIVVVAPTTCSKLVNPVDYDYYCSVALPDSTTLQFRMDYSKNSVEGVVYQGGNVAGSFIGFRTATANGRIVR